MSDEKFYGGLRVGAPVSSIGSGAGLSSNGGSILVEIASGATAQIIPAPPAGYLNVLGFLRLKNVSATQPIGYTVQDSDGNVLAANTTLAAATQSSPIGGPLYTAKAITATVTGLGGPGQFAGMWGQVPIEGPPKLVPFVMNMTLAAQAVPQLVPPAGFASMLLGSNATFGAFCSWTLNRDTASAAYIWQITRSAVVWEGNALGTQAANSRNSSLLICPTILPGDTVKFRLLAAPVAPDTVWCGGCFAFVPIVQ
jgi:hypothetical protein